MSLDLEIAKKYKEYSDLSEKLIPLRNEYNFLVTDIPAKQEEHKTVSKQIEGMKLELQRERQERERERQKEKDLLNASKVAFDTEKNKQLDKISSEVGKLQDEVLFLTRNRDIVESEIVEKTKISNDLIKSVEDNTIKLSKLIIDYDSKLKEYNDMKEYVISKDIELSEREKAVVKKEKDIERETIKYNKIKADAEKNVKYMQHLMLDSIKKEETLLKLQSKIDRDILAVKEDKEKNTKILEDAKAEINTLTQKELEINKKISEFQDEKFKFLVLMKQKGIKKSDIDQLEKDFTL